MSDTGIRLQTPAELLRFARERKLALFLGAGFSKNISSDIPAASSLIKVAARHAHMDERLLALHASNDYMLVAEYLQIKRELDSVLGELSTLIHEKKYRIQDSRPHIQLTEIDCSSIFTTNWDYWIERAFDSVSKPFRVLRDIADLVSQSRPPMGHGASRSGGGKKFYPETSIVKFHGDIHSPASIVFSIRTYFDRIIERTALDSLLETELYTKSFLFIGYSFSDPNLRLIWYKLLRQKRILENINPSAVFPPSYIVTNGNNPIVEGWMGYLGITPIRVDPSPEKLKSSVEKLLDEIIGAQR